MKKWLLRKNIRQGLIAVLLLFLVFALAGLYWSYTRPAVTAVHYTAFPYTSESSVDYQVYLLPNELYEEPYLGSGRAYISSLVDYINTAFVYSFSAENEAEIWGEYSVTASVKALTGQENHLVWEKSYLLLAPETFFVRGQEVLLRENIALPFAEYAAFAGEIVEETGFAPQNINLEVNYNVSLTADTVDGTIEETAAPKLIIPLRGNVFTVGGSLDDKKAGGIPATRLEAVPYYAEARTGFTVISSVLGLFLLVFLQVTAAKKEKNNFVKKKLSRILKQYHDRIVKCTEKIPFPGHGNLLAVASFEDLLKAADELKKPIFYYQRNGENEEVCEHLFFVFCEQYAYRYNLGEVSSAAAMNSLSQNHLARRLR